MISSFPNSSDYEIEILEAPVLTIDLDDYEMVESERETEATLWKDYLILPNSPDSTLPGFGTIINLVVVSDDEDQVVPNKTVISPMVPSFDYPSLPDDPLAAFLRENDTIRRGETPRADTEALVTPTPAQWEPYCYTCGEVDHYLRWCQFYRPYEDPVIRCTLCNEVGHYASECPMVMVGPSEAATRQIAPATTQASTSTVVEDYWSRVGCPCRKCRYRYE
ncbi:Zinc finger CCHC-type [Arabidopsis suecica]|uniref:Zinc finger CCHC-type n=1 Tax=Arabidopsis suecica TaxID=45249 RepID=A0A8T1YSE7_ARASU|nr:Zinc finger CCHC-type [Arabidopsis suecica]